MVVLADPYHYCFFCVQEQAFKRQRRVFGFAYHALLTGADFKRRNCISFSFRTTPDRQTFAFSHAPTVCIPFPFAAADLPALSEGFELF